MSRLLATAVLRGKLQTVGYGIIALAMTTSEERLSRLEGVYDHLASKSDLVEARADLNLGMARLATKEELAAAISQLATKQELAAATSQLATKQEVAEEIAKLRVEEAQRESRLIKWMVGTAVASVAAISSITLAAVALLGR